MNPDDLNKLLPCPFCGGGAEIRACADEMNEGGYFVTCEVCLACSRIQFGEGISEELHEAWNARANTALRERAERAEAGEELERMRLAACGVAALGYFAGCKDEYRSASLDDVLRLLEREEAARKRIADLEAERAALMAAGKVLAAFCKLPPNSCAQGGEWDAIDVFEEQPGALAAWMAREGR